MDVAGAITKTASGIRLRVRAQPRASRSALVSVIDDGRGGVALKVAIAAPPVDGAANAAIVELLASELSVPKRAVSIARGETGREKLVEVAGISVDAAVAVLRSRLG